jgi:hypothetical protein
LRSKSFLGKRGREARERSLERETFLGGTRGEGGAKKVRREEEEG